MNFKYKKKIKIMTKIRALDFKLVIAKLKNK